MIINKFKGISHSTCSQNSLVCLVCRSVPSNALRFYLLCCFCCCCCSCVYYVYCLLCRSSCFFLYSRKAGALPIYINYCIKFGAKLQKVSFSLLRLPRRWRRQRQRRRRRRRPERHTIVYKSLWSTEITWARLRPNSRPGSDSGAVVYCPVLFGLSSFLGAVRCFDLCLVSHSCFSLPLPPLLCSCCGFVEQHMVIKMYRARQMQQINHIKPRNYMRYIRENECECIKIIVEMATALPAIKVTSSQANSLSLFLPPPSFPSLSYSLHF